MKLIAVTLLMLFALPTRADWTELGTLTSGTTVFIDLEPQNVRIDGNLRRAWVLRNVTAGNADGYMSNVTLHEYDCAEGRGRSLKSTGYTKHFAGGDVVFTDNRPTDWSYYAPNTGGDVQLKLVCAIKRRVAG